MWTEVNNRGDQSGYRIPHPSRGGGRGQLRIDGEGDAHRGTFKKYHLQIGGAQKQPQTHFHTLSHIPPPKKKKLFQNRRRKNHQCCVRMWRRRGGNTLTSWCVNRLFHRGFILSTTICRDSLPRQHGHSDVEESGMRRWDACGAAGAAWMGAIQVDGADELPASVTLFESCVSTLKTGEAGTASTQRSSVGL